VYDIPPEKPPQTLFFEVMKEAETFWKKLQPIYKKYMNKIDEIIVKMILEFNEKDEKHSIADDDVVTAIMFLNKLLTEIYKDIIDGKPYVIRKVLEKLGFKLTVGNSKNE